MNKLFGNKQLILVFLYLFSVALAQNTTGITTATTMATTGGNGPLAPHMRPGTPRQCVEWMGNNPPSLWMYFLGGSRVFMDLKVLLCSGNDELPQHRSVLGTINALNSPKSYICLLGGLLPIHLCVSAEQKVLCGVLGGHFRQRRLCSAMVVMVDVGCWRRTSDQPTVGIVKIVYGFFFIPTCIPYNLDI
jgi:hypothetical protein